MCMADKYLFVEKFINKCGFEKNDIDRESNIMFSFRKKDGTAFQICKANIASGGLYPNTDNREFACKLNRGFGFCDSPWKRLAVLANGQLVYCCVDLSGSLAYTQPKEIFNKSLKCCLQDYSDRFISNYSDRKRGRNQLVHRNNCLDFG
jgi:hypothetical protein